MPTNTDIAWAAGLFEGEGCFNNTTVRGRVYARAQLKMTDLDVMERFQAIVGVGTTHKRKAVPGLKQQWQWHISSRAGVEHVAQLLGPYLGERRTAQIERVLSSRSDVLRPWFLDNSWAAAKGGN